MNINQLINRICWALESNRFSSAKEGIELVQNVLNECECLSLSTMKSLYKKYGDDKEFMAEHLLVEPSVSKYYPGADAYIKNGYCLSLTAYSLCNTPRYYLAIISKEGGSEIARTINNY